ncbi:hypothetical protein H2199_004747 [Coniosporium tulheliwenetii]|uniref:Uncharacterized protein n=1 Tax=Coniosporium tulheliwenetii TaxID=3383036 RepID=A0ACC2Z3S1_9PEZI|nr:hypothetical protein H2199_004747 [Cladosporium sp. JES 115]
MELDSPQGLMVHGEVGTGKSMLIDLFAECLPNRKKRRWHFNTFMLETFAKLEQLRRSRLSVSMSGGVPIEDDDHSLLWLARDMIQTSPILFLDEFQLPDRVASKIMSNLMTSFFHLGGVLIATSNRMPEELAKAAGMEFGPPPSRMDSLRWRLGVRPAPLRSGENRLDSFNEFAAFLELLKARCEIWEMESSRDFRRAEVEKNGKAPSTTQLSEDVEVMPVAEERTESTTVPGIGLAAEDTAPPTNALPRNYFVKPADDDVVSCEPLEDWAQAFTTAQLSATSHTSGIPWEIGTMRVYGRTVVIPRHCNGVTSWTFAELCCRDLGPADYITLASTFHTLILTDVPILTWLHKNEARRFITLLDALYEARCKLLISAAAGPDDIFFPEVKGSTDAAPTAVKERLDQDAVYPETFAEAYQDVTAPFRPNISSYSAGSSSPEPGYLSPDALEDDPPNRLRRGAGYAFTEEEPKKSMKNAPDFAQTGAFTGEDERFAYKRARSRLWEMCGAKWWARSEEGWWRPLPKEVRRWETFASVIEPAERAVAGVADTQRAEGMGGAREVDEKSDEVLFRDGASPFRTSAEPPPKISWTHVWGTVKWGKKAGAWGKGVEGLAERKREKNGR